MNEITIIPELLKLTALSRCSVTIEPIGNQTNIPKTIVEAEATMSCVSRRRESPGGIHAKQLQTGWKEEYLLKVLAAEM